MATANTTRAAGVNVDKYGKPLSPTDQANQANFDREQEIRQLLDEVIGTYSPGGSFGAGTEAMIDRQKTKAIGQGTQSLISSGLYGSTMTAGLGTAFEEDVAMPTRLKLEDLRTQKYSDALGQKAGFIEGIENQSPSYETMANLTSQANSAPQESLSDWLGKTFSVQNNLNQGAIDSRNARLAAEEAARNQKAGAYSSSLALGGSANLGSQSSSTSSSSKPIEYDWSMMYGGSNTPSTEAARDARKKAGTYIGSDGKIHQI